MWNASGLNGAPRNPRWHGYLAPGGIAGESTRFRPTLPCLEWSACRDRVAASLILRDGLNKCASYATLLLEPVYGLALPTSRESLGPAMPAR